MATRSRIDAVHRYVYRVLARVRGLYFRLFDPPRHGTLVAVWYGGRLLVTKSSYHDFYSVPGGYARRGEDGAHAAARELKEEVGIPTEAGLLLLHDDITRRYQGRRSGMSFFELHLSADPAVRIDHREIVSARFLTPEEALELPLFPAVALLLRERLGRD